jgi:hypothetical protein
MGNIISNCCSNSLIFSIKNYFCGAYKIDLFELILQEEKFFSVCRKSPPIFTLENSYSKPQLIFLNGFTATNGASPSLQGSCLTHSNLR